MKKIAIMTPAYNEEGGIRECYEAVRKIFETRLPGYRYEHVFIDNCSEDRTVEILREIAAVDRNVKVIVNSRNFGHVRSPYYGLMQASGDAVIPVLADLQTPPELIVEFVRLWEQGYPMVLGIRAASDQGFVMRFVRGAFYRMMAKLSDVQFSLETKVDYRIVCPEGSVWDGKMCAAPVSGSSRTHWAAVKGCMARSWASAAPTM